MTLLGYTALALGAAFAGGFYFAADVAEMVSIAFRLIGAAVIVVLIDILIDLRRERRWRLSKERD